MSLHSKELKQFHVDYPHIYTKYLAGDDIGMYYLVVNETTQQSAKVYITDKEKADDVARKLLDASHSLI